MIVDWTISNQQFPDLLNSSSWGEEENLRKVRKLLCIELGYAWAIIPLPQVGWLRMFSKGSSGTKTTTARRSFEARSLGCYVQARNP
jgi:hypothetical protein